MSIPGMSRHVRSRLPGAIIRRARHADYEAVLKLPTTELDYLPGLYPSCIDHPKRRIYVCELEKEIVALEMLCIMDDGDLVVSRAGRVKPSLQGRGIMSSVLQHGLEDIKRQYPIKRFAWTTTNAEQTRELLKWNTRIQCAEKVVLQFNTTSMSLKSILLSNAYRGAFDEYTSNALRVLRPEEAYSFMTSLQNQEALFPSGLMVVRYEVFSPIQCNYYIPIEEFKSTIITSARAGGRLSDLSFGSFIRCSYGYRYNLDFYVDKTATIHSKSKLLLLHVMKHLVMIGQRQLSENISVGIYFPKDIDTTELKDILQNKLNRPKSDMEYEFSASDHFLLTMNLEENIAKL